MSAIKDGRFAIELDRKRHMLFSLNVMDELEDKFDSIENLPEIMSGKNRMKNIKWLFTLLLNEGAAEGEEPLTEIQVGKMIHSDNMKAIQNAIMQAFLMGSTGSAEPPTAAPEDESDDDYDDEEPEKNAQAGKSE